MNMEFRCSELLETTASLQVSNSDAYRADGTPYQTISVAVAKVHFILDLGPCIWNKAEPRITLHVKNRLLL